jgi:uncharacterized protein YaaN involved in tellurite resistance
MSTQLTPPEPSGVVLTPPVTLEAPPKAAELVKVEDAPGMVPITAEVRAEKERVAEAFSAELAAMDPRDPKFAAQIAQVETLGRAEVQRSSAVSSEILKRSTTSVAGAKGTGDSGSAAVASALADLRVQVDTLTPSAELSKPRRLLKMLPGGDRLTSYFQRYQSAEAQLNGIVKAISRGRDMLIKDNISLQKEREGLWALMGSLGGDAVLLGSIDTELSRRIEDVRATDPDRASALTADALLPIRQRRQDILTQITVSVQSYISMGLIIDTNKQLIRGADGAQTTTMAALRNAIIVAEALNNQRLVLAQIDALNSTTNSMILKTSEMLRDNATKIHQQASSSGISMDVLRQSFDNIYATMDAIDQYRVGAAESLSASSAALEEQIVRARPYLERSRAQDSQAQLDAGRSGR